MRRPKGKKEIIESHYQEAVEKAWDNLERNKFSMFGYWAAKESQLNTIADQINKKSGSKVIKTRSTNKSPFFSLKQTAVKRNNKLQRAERRGLL